jgi:hypothetical protein
MTKPRTLLIALAMLVIASLACSVSTAGTPTPAPTPTEEPTVELPTATIAPTSTRAPTPKPKPTATTASVPTGVGVLFSDDFSSQQATEDNGWNFDSTDNVDRAWAPNQYTISVHKTNYLGYGTPDGEYTDFGAEAEAQATSEYAKYGLRFRIADGDNYYIFVITTDGKYYVDKLVQDEWADPSPVKSTASQYIKKGKVKNRLGVLAQGSKISLYINGFLVKTFTDDSIDSGSVGVLAGAGDNDTAETVFSRFTVLTAAQAAADWGTTPAGGGTQPTATPTKSSSGGGGTGVLLRNTFPGACQANLWGKKEAVIRAEGNSSKFMALPAGTYGVHLAVDIGEVDLAQFTIPSGVTCVITCDKATKSVYNSCR